MKKISALIAMFLCVTIGGVYATWSYAGTNDIADQQAEMKVTIAGASLTGANGEYTIESNLVLTIDQANDDHEAELVFASNNSEAIYLKVTFTPATNAPQIIKDEAVASELYFDTTLTMEYTMDSNGNYDATGTAKPIFTFANPSNTEFSPNISGVAANDSEKATKWTKESDGTFTYTMNEAALRAQIQLSQTFVLDIKAEYDAFGEALKGNIVARITDGNVTP